MKNTDALDFFRKIVNESEHPDIAIKLKSGDHSDLDAAFIERYVCPTDLILDIGSGSGLIVNKIYKRVKSIIAVEPCEKLSAYIQKDPKITVVNKNFFDYETDRKIDVITAFGTMHYFNRDESAEVYSRCFSMLKTGGLMLIKNQFGVNSDIQIENFSTELNMFYYAQYRALSSEIEALRKIGFQEVVSFDIYPPECNRWVNTHFYAITAKKP